MAIAISPPFAPDANATGAPLLTYEAYLEEPQVEGRYDIVDGRRMFAPPATFRHQRILGNLLFALVVYEQSHDTGRMVGAPYDVLIRRTPRLQMRQPDALFITHEALATLVEMPEAPLTVAPALVVEIVSNSKTEAILASKLADYAAIGVPEAWVVRPAARTIDVLRLALDAEPETIASYGDGDILRSVVLTGLAVPVTELFAL